MSEAIVQRQPQPAAPVRVNKMDAIIAQARGLVHHLAEIALAVDDCHAAAQRGQCNEALRQNGGVIELLLTQEGFRRGGKGRNRTTVIHKQAVREGAEQGLSGFERQHGEKRPVGKHFTAANQAQRIGFQLHQPFAGHAHEQGILHGKGKMKAIFGPPDFHAAVAPAQQGIEGLKIDIIANHQRAPYVLKLAVLRGNAVAQGNVAQPADGICREIAQLALRAEVDASRRNCQRAHRRVVDGNALPGDAVIDQHAVIAGIDHAVFILRQAPVLRCCLVFLRAEVLQIGNAGFLPDRNCGSLRAQRCSSRQQGGDQVQRNFETAHHAHCHLRLPHFGDRKVNDFTRDFYYPKGWF